MDRRVKERLVGATILTFLVVLIVPELLSGPKPAAVPPPANSANPAGPIRNVTVDLATSEATVVEPSADATAGSQALPVTSGEAPDPSPSSAGVATEAPTARPSAPAQLENPPAVPHTPTSVRKPQAVTGVKGSSPAAHWSVQLGSFANRANAENLVMRVKSNAPSAYVASSGSGAAVRYRVRVGPLADRSTAERIVARFKRQGVAATLVPP